MNNDAQVQPQDILIPEDEGGIYKDLGTLPAGKELEEIFVL